MNTPPPNLLTRRQREIQDIIEARDIEQLVHFTDIRNLQLIRKHGILSVSEMDRLGVKYYHNDSNRYDRRPNRISCSVTLHNKYVLEKFHKATQRDWILIYIDPMVCVHKNCKFFYTNAANSIFQLPDYGTDLKSPKAFGMMFMNPVNVYSSYQERTFWRNSKPPNEPTDVQAEVMVKKRIPRKFLKSCKKIEVGV